MIGAAVLLGATTPPAASIIRSAWPRLVPEAALPAAYAVDNAVNELMFIVGPLLVPVMILAMTAHDVVAAAGAAVLLGTALLLASPTIRRAAPAPPGRLRPAGPLGHRRTVLLLSIAALGTFTFGCLRVATVASATVFGSAASAGVLMGLLSAGALLGTLGYGARAWPVTGVRLLVLLSLAEAVVLLAGGWAPSFVALAVLIAVVGLATGPRDAVVPTLLADHTPPTTAPRSSPGSRPSCGPGTGSAPPSPVASSGPSTPAPPPSEPPRSRPWRGRSWPLPPTGPPAR
ncbi:hypothetical protein ACFQYP_41090 [Nonomuraea antimicrobica]